MRRSSVAVKVRWRSLDKAVQQRWSRHLRRPRGHSRCYSYRYAKYLKAFHKQSHNNWLIYLEEKQPDTAPSQEVQQLSLPYLLYALMKTGSWKIFITLLFPWVRCEPYSSISDLWGCLSHFWSTLTSVTKCGSLCVIRFFNCSKRKRSCRRTFPLCCRTGRRWRGGVPPSRGSRPSWDHVWRRLSGRWVSQTVESCLSLAGGSSASASLSPPLSNKSIKNAPKRKVLSQRWQLVGLN